MDSINKNQPEKNKENLLGKEAIEKIKELAKKAVSCFFCTKINEGSFETRPMSAEKIDDEGNFWFLSASDSHKNEQITNDPSVQLVMQGSAHSDFLSINGRAEISKDKNKIEELWDGIMKTWFTEGKDDPRITVIKVISENGYYWDTKHGQAVGLVKMVVGAIAGKTLDDSIEGKIKV
ncbi:MAG: pyridoxamine 5'-phosphate oxidase family protein [Parafilimonas sp.]